MTMSDSSRTIARRFGSMRNLPETCIRPSRALRASGGRTAASKAATSDSGSANATIARANVPGRANRNATAATASVAALGANNSLPINIVE